MWKINNNWAQKYKPIKLNAACAHSTPGRVQTCYSQHLEIIVWYVVLWQVNTKEDSSSSFCTVIYYMIYYLNVYLCIACSSCWNIYYYWVVEDTLSIWQEDMEKHWRITDWIVATDVLKYLNKIKEIYNIYFSKIYKPQNDLNPQSLF